MQRETYPDIPRMSSVIFRNFRYFSEQRIETDVIVYSKKKFISTRTDVLLHNYMFIPSNLNVFLVSVILNYSCFYFLINRIESCPCYLLRLFLAFSALDMSAVTHRTVSQL